MNDTGCTREVNKRLAVTGLILAGGQGLRMGGQDKGLVDYKDKPLVDWVIERLLPQVDELLISANRNLDEYSNRGYRVVTDSLPDFQGPLAGMLAGLQLARHEWMLSVPCDVPHLPRNLVMHLAEHAAGREAVFARDAERDHPAILLLNKACLPKLMDYLEKGERSVKGLLGALNVAAAAFPDPAAFGNMNEASQLEQ
jgi:molybdopterin-guanine dinucleotide biosynthesis protein A